MPLLLVLDLQCTSLFGHSSSIFVTTCPVQLHINLLVFSIITVTQALLLISMFWILFLKVTLSMLLSICLWATLSISALFSVSVTVSRP
ncbi:hypothetical protein HHI36_016636 [Cryptolaemus montrouzieri]|uniref:NADH dehydrogenase subunit 4L n=1 Tax=Cryptolaemus montrouzieri TaxID=559131 RepID=A0ABD2NL45_9CUCU